MAAEKGHTRAMLKIAAMYEVQVTANLQIYIRVQFFSYHRPISNHLILYESHLGWKGKHGGITCHDPSIP